MNMRKTITNEWQQFILNWSQRLDLRSSHNHVVPQKFLSNTRGNANAKTMHSK